MSLVAVPSEGLLMPGALGATVSTVMLTAVEAPEVLPAASLAVAVIEPGVGQTAPQLVEDGDGHDGGPVEELSEAG